MHVGLSVSYPLPRKGPRGGGALAVMKKFGPHISARFLKLFSNRGVTGLELNDWFQDLKGEMQDVLKSSSTAPKEESAQYGWDPVKGTGQTEWTANDKKFRQVGVLPLLLSLT